MNSSFGALRPEQRLGHQRCSGAGLCWRLCTTRTVVLLLLSFQKCHCCVTWIAAGHPVSHIFEKTGKFCFRVSKTTEETCHCRQASTIQLNTWEALAAAVLSLEPLHGLSNWKHDKTFWVNAETFMISWGEKEVSDRVIWWVWYRWRDRQCLLEDAYACYRMGGYIWLHAYNKTCERRFLLTIQSPAAVSRTWATDGGTCWSSRWDSMCLEEASLLKSWCSPWMVAVLLADDWLCMGRFTFYASVSLFVRQRAKSSASWSALGLKNCSISGKDLLLLRF